MEWHQQFARDQQPSLTQISGYIDSPCWEELRAYLEQTLRHPAAYRIQPVLRRPRLERKIQKRGPRPLYALSS